MNCVLIYRDLSDKEIQQVKEQYAKGAALFISPLVTIPQEFSQLKTGSIFLEEAEKKRLAHSIKDELLDYGNQVINSKSIKDWLTINKTSLWYYHKHRIYLQLRDYFYSWHEIRKHSQGHKQTHVFSSLVFPVEDFENITFYYKKSNEKGLQLSETCHFLFSFMWRACIGLVQRIKHRSKKHIIISNRKALGRYLNLKTLKEDVEDVFLGYLRQLTDSSFLFINDVEVQRPGIRFSKTRARSTRTYPALNAEYILIAGLARISNIITLLKKHHQLRYAYQIVSKSQDETMGKLITQQLIQLHKSSLFYFFKLLAFENFFAKKNYKTITAKDENSTSTKIILDAAKSHNIITIGIQHGVIGDLNINYLFTKEDESFHPMPDHTLVWGNYWKSILINEMYFPANAIKTVGQIRTDVIPKLKGNSKGHFFSEQSNYNHTLVFASQLQPDLVLKKQSAEDVFKAVSKLKSTLLIVKMHPRENDMDYYVNIANNIGFSNYIIEKEMDLYKVISGCDGLITCYSTVGGEAVYFDKPLVILDHLKLDYCGYYQEGVAKRAINAMELEQRLLEMIENKFVIDTGNYERFKRNYAYKIDGNVSKRCLDFIKGFK